MRDYLNYNDMINDNEIQETIQFYVNQITKGINDIDMLFEFMTINNSKNFFYFLRKNLHTLNYKQISDLEELMIENGYDFEDVANLIVRMLTKYKLQLLKKAVKIIEEKFNKERDLTMQNDIISYLYTYYGDMAVYIYKSI